MTAGGARRLLETRETKEVERRGGLDRRGTRRAYLISNPLNRPHHHPYRVIMR